MYIRFIYLMPWKFVGDVRFHEVLQTSIIRQITKRNEEIEKIEKLLLCTNLYVCLSLWWGVILANYCVWMCKWCLIYMCVWRYIRRAINLALFKEFFLCSTVVHFATTAFSYPVNKLKFIAQRMDLHTHTD